MSTQNQINQVDIPVMMQAIIQIANGQKDITSAIDILSNKVQFIENKLDKPEEDVIKMFREYMTLTPDQLELANTQGYSYNGIIEAMSMKEIKSRLRRLGILTGQTFNGNWRLKMFKAIGKDLSEIRCEAMAFCIKNNPSKTIKTMYDAIEAIPEYLKWGTVILLDLERQNGICKNIYTRNDLFKSQSKEFNWYDVEKLNNREFEDWLIRRFEDFSKMCNVNSEKGKLIAYNSFTKIGTSAKRWVDDSYYSWAKLFTGDMDKDIDTIININSNYKRNIRYMFMQHIIDCLVV